MTPETLSRFRAFAQSFNDDELVDDNGLTGKDLKDIADLTDKVVWVPRLTK